MKKCKDALQQKRPRWTRRRLQAIDLLLGGETLESAADKVGIRRTALRHWISIVNKSGWKALLQFGYGRAYDRKKAGVSRPQAPARQQAETERRDVAQAIRTATLRADLAQHLAMTLSQSDRQRLTALDNVLAGQSLKAVARQCGCTTETVRNWRRRLKRSGAGALILSPPPEPLLKADSDALRALAAMDCLRPISRALIALAHLAEGRNLTRAANSVRAGTDTVTAWLTAYQDDGVVGIWHHVHRSPRRFHASRLSAEQMQAIVDVMGSDALPVMLRQRQCGTANATIEPGVTTASI